MARKYTRDNRGRFASSGGGATARGGRLKTAAGNKRATQTMTAKGAGGPAGTIAKGGNGVRGSVARSLAATRKPAAAPAKAAPKAVTPKAAPNAAKQRYKQASSTARAVGRDLRGASPMERRTANSKAAVVRNMERNRSTATASAANSPKAAQKAKEVARAKRAQSQYTAGMAREADGPGSKASRKVTVARRAMQIYSGKVDPKAKATARLTKTTDQYKLQDRIRRSAKLKPPKAAKPAAPAQAKAAPKAPAIQASGRTRAEAASAQRQRSRATIEATRGQVIGRQRGVTATAGGGEKVRVRRAAVEQGSLLGGSDVVRKAVATRVAASKGPAPGSKAARSTAGKNSRANETPAQRLSRVGQRAGTNDASKGPEARRKAAKGFSATSPKKMAQAVKTGKKARTYVIRQKEKMRG